MKELAMRFIDKECVISSFDGNHQYDGIIKEVTDGALLLEKDGKIEAINLDFVIRIREYPRNKKGKKKAIVAVSRKILSLIYYLLSTGQLYDNEVAMRPYLKE